MTPPHPSPSLLGTRLRLMFEQLEAGVTALYAELGLDGFRPRFTPFIRTLGRFGPASIRDLAWEIGVTHSAASQTVAQLTKAGLVTSTPGEDARQRIVNLTPKAEALLPKLDAEWAAVTAAAVELESELSYPLSVVVSEVLDALERRPMAERTTAKLRNTTSWTAPPLFEVTAPDGRRITACLYGPADGMPVISLHGTPGTRWERPDIIEAFSAVGLRVLVPDRPGYGGSTRLVGRAVGDVASDVRALADSFGWERFAVTGFSGGAPHALACAALLPDRVTRCAAVASLAPIAMDELGDGFRLALEGEEALRPHIERRAREVLSQGTDDVGKVERTRAAYFGGRDGWVDDRLALVRPWGFSPASIEVPVSVWFNRSDPRCPPSHVEWLLDNIPGVEGYVYPGEHEPGEADLRRILAWINSP